MGYPVLEINIGHIKHNIEAIKERLGELGISFWAVSKGATSDMEIVKAMIECGVKTVGSSRLSQIKKIKEAFPNVETAMVRMAMISEAAEVVKYVDVSVESELETIKCLNEEAKKQGIRHAVVLMQDTGDLREGFFDVDELVCASKYIEKNLKNIELRGIGTNVGCVGCVMPTPETLEKLVAGAKKIEEAIGRKLEIVSGGATSSLLRVIAKDMPSGINHLRLGEAILNARDLKVNYGIETPWLYDDCFIMKAEVIEAKKKASHPIGTLVVDAFGNKPNFTDRGMRNRAIIALGKADYGSTIDFLIPIDDGIEVIGASSDHTIIDFEDYKPGLKVGDVVKFKLQYVSMLFATDASDVSIKYIY